MCYFLGAVFVFLNPDGCSKRSAVPADQVGRKEKALRLENELWRAVLAVTGL